MYDSGAQIADQSEAQFLMKTTAEKEGSVLSPTDVRDEFFVTIFRKVDESMLQS